MSACGGPLSSMLKREKLGHHHRILDARQKALVATDGVVVPVQQPRFQLEAGHRAGLREALVRETGLRQGRLRGQPPRELGVVGLGEIRACDLLSHAASSKLSMST
ncbi:MAG: hypothetical protein QM742_16450 [Aquabacterium sp.]